MSLSERLGQPLVLRPLSLPAPAKLLTSVNRVLARWPDIVPEPPERDRDRLVAEMLRRLEADDWQNVNVSFVTSAARALFDPERRNRYELARLRRFYCDEIEVNESRTFLAAMMSIYLGSYVPGANHTTALAASLSKVVARLDSRSRLLLDTVPEVLSPSHAASAIAAKMMEMSNPWTGLRGINLRSPHAPGIMDFAHLAFVQALAPSLDHRGAVDRLLGWLKPEGQEARMTGAGEAIAALLLPWRGEEPPEDLRSELTTTLVSCYGDPRVRKGTGAWAAVPGELMAIFLRWLAGENIKFFLDVVSAVEDSHMWAPRKKFWLGLYNQKRIDDAWVAFSKAAARYARNSVGNRIIKFGHQTAGGSREDTCLLILKIGRKIVVEGSHSYKVHIFDEKNPRAPKLHQLSYDCEAIRSLPGARAKAHLGYWEGWVLENI